MNLYRWIFGNRLIRRELSIYHRRFLIIWIIMLTQHGNKNSFNFYIFFGFTRHNPDDGLTKANCNKYNIQKNLYHFLLLLSLRLLDDVLLDLLLLLFEDISPSSPFTEVLLCFVLPWSGRSSKSCSNCLSDTSTCFLLRFELDVTDDPFWCVEDSVS